MSTETFIVEAASFWFVWTKKGHVPRKAHTLKSEAIAEAVRLANLHPGHKYIVLQAVAKYSAVPTVPTEVAIAA